MLAEHLQRRGDPSDLIPAGTHGDGNGQVTGGEAMHRAGYGPQRTGQAVDDDQQGEDSHHPDARPGRDRDQRSHTLPESIEFGGQPVHLCRIAFSKRHDRAVDRLAVGSVRLVVADAIGGGSALGPSGLHQFGPQPHEAVDTAGAILEQVTAAGVHQGGPARHAFLDARQIDQQGLAEPFNLGAVLGHVDAARVHDDGIDQAVHLFPDDGPFRGTLHQPDGPAIDLGGVDAGPASDGGGQAE